MAEVCERMEMTRQNYYKRRKEREDRSLGDEMLCKHVIDIRADHPRMGGRKLLTMISKDLSMHGLRIGRDKLFKVLRDKGLLVVSTISSPSLRATRSRRSVTRTEWC